MDRKEVSTQTALEEATVSSENITTKASNTEKKEVSTQTVVEATASSTQPITDRISNDRQADVITSDEDVDQQVKNPTAKRKDSSGGFKDTVNSGTAVCEEEYSEVTTSEKRSVVTAGNCDDPFDGSEDNVNRKGDEPVDENEMQNTDETSSIRTIIDLNTEKDDSSAEMQNTIAEAARVPETFHAPDCKRRRQFLSPDETQALIKLQNEVGVFSFFICGDGRVIIHPEDEMAMTNRGDLERRFLAVVGETSRDFKISVKDSSFMGNFCTHRIGAKVMADSRQTTAGMYVSHNGVLYLISSAHNYVFSESGYDGSEKKQLLLLDEGRAFIDVAGEKVPLRPLYGVFSKMCDLKDKGRNIMHLVDISIALSPFCTSHMHNKKAQYCASIEEGQDSCRDCGLAIEDCTDSRHRRDSNPCQFKISGFYDFGRPMGCCSEIGEEQLRRYYDEKLLSEGGALVRCRPCDRSVVAGKILSFDNAVTVRIDEQRMVTATNVLLIAPVQQSLTPMLGDSGSVWVLDGTCDAVAITVGLGQSPDGGLLWAATPLQPMLEALCFAFPNVFPEVSSIKPACHGSTLSSTAPSSAAMVNDETFQPQVSTLSITASLASPMTESDAG